MERPSNLDFDAIAPTVFETLSIQAGQKLGEGRDGAVYALDAGHVAKITTSPGEAAAAAVLKNAGLGLKHGLPEMAPPFRVDFDGFSLWTVIRTDMKDVRCEDSATVDDLLERLWDGGKVDSQRLQNLGDTDAALVKDVMKAFANMKRLGVHVQDVQVENLGLLPDGTASIRDFGSALVPANVYERVRGDAYPLAAKAAAPVAPSIAAE